MTDFTKFSFPVNARLNLLSKGELFVTDATSDEIWDTYLSAFPEGTNPIYKTRTEYDCSGCKNFVKNLGSVVAVVDGKLTTVWELDSLEYPFNIVAEKMHNFLTSKKITGLFRTTEKTYGAKVTKQVLPEGTINWNHFYGDVATKFITSTPDKACGDYATTVQVFQRGLEELTTAAITEVQDLITGNSIYRGEEHKASVDKFSKLHAKYQKLSPSEKNIFVWENAKESVSRFRNTVIGTLVQDLSDGVDITKAVKSFEDKVAPENYKRPTALITQKMIDDAMKTIQELNIEDDLQRRLAKISDITINNVLWADKDSQDKMKSNLHTLLSANVKPKALKASETEVMSIEDFVSKILPKTKSMELLVKNSMQTNFVTLTTGLHEQQNQLFQWDNNFAWSYNGNLTDSDLRKTVQSRGGRVDGVFRFSHQWNYDKRNASLMDLHVFMPGNLTRAENGVHDLYGNTERVGWNNRSHHNSGGTQDVDYTSAAPVGYVPVENITFPSINRMPEGQYVCKIHNWAHRNPTEGGFKAEIEFSGQVFQYEYLKPLKDKEWVTVAVVTLKNGQFSIEHKLPHASSSKEIWGVQTEQFVKVNTLMNSPNFWDDNAVGNKHWIFTLEGCKVDEPARGIYNEFLSNELTKHRKVFEVLGNKTKCPMQDDQLSGVGFSSTQKEEVQVKVQGDNFQKVITIKF